MNLLKFPSYKQSLEYDCGPAALRAAFLYYGLNISKRELMRIAHTNKDGTLPKNMEKALRKFGFKFKAGKLSVAKVKRALKKGAPVILLIQDWDEGFSSWSKRWDDGHYAIAVGYDRTNFYFEDLRNPGLNTLSFKDLPPRWHDLAGGRRYLYYGLIIYGRSKLRSFLEKIILKR